MVAMSAGNVMKIIPQEANPIGEYVLTTMKGDVENCKEADAIVDNKPDDGTQELRSSSERWNPDPISLVYRLVCLKGSQLHYPTTDS